MDAQYLLGHALGDFADGIMGVGRGAQLAEVICAPQVELGEHAAVESVGNNLLCNVRIPCGKFFIGLSCFLHGSIIL
jgi:hypothetical protein